MMIERTDDEKVSIKSNVKTFVILPPEWKKKNNLVTHLVASNQKLAVYFVSVFISFHIVIQYRKV